MRSTALITEPLDIITPNVKAANLKRFAGSRNSWRAFANFVVACGFGHFFWNLKAYEIAFSGHAFIHSPHFAHVISGCCFFSWIVVMSIAPNGQAFAHFMHPLHLSVSIFIWNALTLSVREANAPNGQSELHCVLRFVRIGNTTTSERNKPIKITAAINVGIEVIGSNSVTSLNGQNQLQ